MFIQTACGLDNHSSPRSTESPGPPCQPQLPGGEAEPWVCGWAGTEMGISTKCCVQKTVGQEGGTAQAGAGRGVQSPSPFPGLQDSILQRLKADIWTILDVVPAKKEL